MYEIYCNFSLFKTEKTPTTNKSNDFIKKLSYFPNVDTLTSLSENNTLIFYKIMKDQITNEVFLSQTLEKKYEMNILYDIILEKLSQNPNQEGF